MSIKEKLKKFNMIMVTIIVLLSLGVFTGCNSEKEKIKNDLSMKDIEYTSAIIEKNNNIYLYDKNNSYLEPIGELSKLKELTALSDNYKKLAFKYSDQNDEINIYDMENRDIKKLKIDENGQISYIKWFDNLIVVGLYENPNTNKYLVYDSETLELINSCRGILIDVMDKGKSIVYGLNTKGTTSIYINDKIIYTLDNQGEVLLGGKVSPDKKEISFLTFVFDRNTFEQKEYLYTGKLKDNKFDDVKVYDKPYEIYGDIEYDGNKLIILNQDEYTELVDERFITKNITEVNKSIAENTNKLKDILENTFKSEIIDIDMSWTELGITSITWFTR